MEKIRIMLVDDDRLAVEYMKQIVDWEKLGYEIVAVAYNGKQALNLINRFSPHLVITDISMPQMDGIELSKKIKELAPDVRIVLLTAYGEFEYAREAVALGADYYMIKDEVNAEYLEEKLRFIKGLIDDRERVSRILFQKVILDYFQMGEAYVRSFYQEKAVIDFLDSTSHYLVVEQNFPIILDEKWEIPMAERDLPRLLDVCLELVQESHKVDLHSILPGNRILFVLSGGAENHSGGEYEEIQRNHFLAERICSRLNDKSNQRYTVYTTEHRISFRELCCCIQEEDSVFGAVKFLGAGRTYDLRRQCLKEEGIPERVFREDVKRSIMDGSFLTELAAMYDKCSMKKSGDKVLFVYCKMAYECLFQEEKRQYALWFCSDSVNDGLYDFQGIRRYLEQYYRKICTLTGETGTKVFRVETKKAMEYIREHYGDAQLKVSDIAGYLGISESRISVIFKEDTQKTLIQYLTGVRMERAKQLLTTTDMKIYEIAEAVGYHNTQYMSNVFAKEIGCFPLEYRRKKGRE